MGDKGSAPKKPPISAASWRERFARVRENREAQQPVTRKDLKVVTQQLKREIDKSAPRSNPAVGSMVGRVARMAGKGLSDINKSMTTPYAPKNRMAIAQMPEKKPPIARSANLGFLKDPALRGRDIRGMRERSKEK